MGDSGAATVAAQIPLPVSTAATMRPGALAGVPQVAAAVDTIVGDVTGRVIHTDGPFDEPAEFDWLQLLGRIGWVLNVLLLPITCLALVDLALGHVVAILVAGAAFVLTVFVLPWGKLLFGAHFLMLFRSPRRANDHFPVRYLRVRSADDGRELIVRLKGHVQGGNVMQDDRVAAWGRWRHGVLQARRLVNLRTGAEVRLDTGNAGASLWTALAAGGMQVAIIFICLMIILLR